MSQLFGPIRQIGYVVHDIESAMHHWTTTLHIGPFYHIAQMPVIDLHYRGKRHLPKASIALAYSGPLQIELIQLLDKTPSAYLDFLARGREGMHHIGFFTEHYDLDLQRAAEAGLQVEQSTVASDPAGKSTCFAAHGHAGTTLKLVALGSANRDLFQMIQIEAERWDGSGPIRHIDL